MKINTYVLSTANLEPSLINTAMVHGIELDALPFVEVEPVRNQALAEELESLCKVHLTVVFTSANAISAISGTLKKFRPQWNVYCIGNATRKAVLEFFDEASIKGTATDGAGLAATIKSHDVSGVTFFCGDKRLDALPDFLYRNDIMVREIVVYKTRETPEQVVKHYQGFMFFSPNGVNSFFRINKISPNAVLFAIGNTTAAALSAKANNKVIVCETPSKALMVDTVIQYFHK
jgi:uroporphyrinogen-III synthase